MTCIIGVLDGGKVYLGGDSCGSDGYTYEDCCHSKVFKVGDFVIGGTTSFRMLDLLEYSLTLPEGQPFAKADMDKFMRTTFVNAVRKCLKEGGFVRFKDSVEQGGTFLIGYKDKIWRMQDDFSVISRFDYDAVGCGAQAAMGSLFTTKDLKVSTCEEIPIVGELIVNDVMSVEDRITLAMKAAESVLVGVKGPFTIIST